MRLERHGYQRRIAFTGNFRCTTNHRLMAAMDAIEISNDNSAAFEVRWNIAEVPKNAHLSFVTVCQGRAIP